ncbi:MAG: tripartite tricarboxylate transporter substrate binding protein [Pigmentiphaga sp.]|uniref:Bug family tripartite tricarboxylate transporter substrate binding protein n=1 Tax=Pigmentiphaga sp. TaxID=1977564 RepID=UPI0029AC606E|nr:tripartite tricarboxylate transporter substrate binding protein [Pigmentiphaga sp.]MDX3907806.1 tripartite tricarboxylate transporter substrate binding protein [Pigmentiphaga sp.]
MALPSTRLRRALSAASMAAASLAAASAYGQGEDWPAQPVHVVVGFAPGGTADMVARAVSQKLSETLKQSFIVENRPGAGGNVATQYTARAKPDGYTLILNTVGAVAVNPALYKKLPADPVKDFVPVVQVANVPNVLVVHPSVPVKTLEEFIAYLRKHPGKLSYGSTGVGTSAHLSAVMFNQRVDASSTHIPYKGGGTVLNDLLAGRLQYMFATIPYVVQQLGPDKLLPLAVTSSKRSSTLPGVPTLAEQGFPDYESGSWLGFFVPKGTPAPVVARLNQAVNQVLPSIEAQMRNEGADVVGGSEEQFAQFIARESAKWREVVESTGASAD